MSRSRVVQYRLLLDRDLSLSWLERSPQRQGNEGVCKLMSIHIVCFRAVKIEKGGWPCFGSLPYACM